MFVQLGDEVCVLLEKRILEFWNLGLELAWMVDVLRQRHLAEPLWMVLE